MAQKSRAAAQTESTWEKKMSRNKTLSEAANLRRAAILEERGQYDKAIRSVMKALSAQSDNPETWIKLGELYRALEQWDLAVQAYRRSLELEPDNHTAQEALLQTHLEAGRYDEAIAGGKMILKRHAKSVYARDIMGVAYLQTGMIDEAIRVTDELIRLEPTDATNHFKKAVLLQQKGEVGFAAREFARVLDMAPESGIADQARQAVSTLENFQIRQIVSLAAEDNIFRAKLVRDPESAAFEKGFFLSYSGLHALRQISFDTPPDAGSDGTQKYYHYH